MAKQNLLGYQSDFLGDKISLPEITQEIGNELATLKNSNETELKYLHFSCVVHKRRMLPLFTAVNIKGDEFKPISRGEDVWAYDERIDEAFQLGEELYSNDENTAAKYMHFSTYCGNLLPFPVLET